MRGRSLEADSDKAAFPLPSTDAGRRGEARSIEGETPTIAFAGGEQVGSGALPGTEWRRASATMFATTRVRVGVEIRLVEASGAPKRLGGVDSRATLFSTGTVRLGGVPARADVVCIPMLPPRCLGGVAGRVALADEQSSRWLTLCME